MKDLFKKIIYHASPIHDLDYRLLPFEEGINKEESIRRFNTNEDHSKKRLLKHLFRGMGYATIGLGIAKGYAELKGIDIDFVDSKSVAMGVGMIDIGQFLFRHYLHHIKDLSKIRKLIE